MHTGTVLLVGLRNYAMWLRSVNTWLPFILYRRLTRNKDCRRQCQKANTETVRQGALKLFLSYWNLGKTLIICVDENKLCDHVSYQRNFTIKI